MKINNHRSHIPYNEYFGLLLFVNISFHQSKSVYYFSRQDGTVVHTVKLLASRIQKFKLKMVS